MSKKKLLIIDDEESFGRLVKLNLELMGGFEVSTAINGKQGIELAKKVKPDLILLDILMPHMDGFETLKILKEDEDTIEIPVIILTAKGDEASKIKATPLSGELYITKPIDAADLKTRIEEVLKRRVK